LKMKLFLNRQSRTSCLVCSNSSSVSVGNPTMKSLAIRKQDTEAKTTVKAFGTQVAKGRATEVIHKPGQDRLTEKAPIEG